MIAEVGNNFMGQYVFATLAVIGGIGGVLAIASFFATRAEVQDLKVRQAGTEQLIEKLRTEGSSRGKHLHNRIDRTNRLLDRIAGKLGVGIPIDEPEEQE